MWQVKRGSTQLEESMDQNTVWLQAGAKIIENIDKFGHLIPEVQQKKDIVRLRAIVSDQSLTDAVRADQIRDWIEQTELGTKLT